MKELDNLTNFMLWKVLCREERSSNANILNGRLVLSIHDGGAVMENHTYLIEETVISAT